MRSWRGELVLAKSDWRCGRAGARCKGQGVGGGGGHATGRARSAGGGAEGQGDHAAGGESWETCGAAGKAAIPGRGPGDVQALNILILAVVRTFWLSTGRTSNRILSYHLLSIRFDSVTPTFYGRYQDGMIAEPPQIFREIVRIDSKIS